MKIKTLSLAALSLLLFGSCKKDKANSCDKSMAAIAGTYSITKIEIGSNGNFVDVDDRDACEKDDHIVLNQNGTLQYQDDGITCDPNGEDSGTWNIDSNGKITMSGAGDFYAQTADVTSFDCTNLVITGTESGIQYRVTFKK